ncbi:MAG: hypothetical protein PHY95_03605 [Candidatus ainarchaeum sp.]|nr:hypothetical protein [Candidatus ainarchaeum sp.]
MKMTSSRILAVFGFAMLLLFAGCAQQGGAGTQGGTAAACTDSDGGRDTYSAGTVSLGSVNRSDSCVDAYTIREYYCEDGAILGASELSCGTGYACTDGACTAVPCTDSDGGEVGETRGTAAAGATSNEDTCAGEASVTEYYCSEGAILSSTISCGEGKHCVEGACIAYTCTDSDGGQETGEAGTASIGDNRKTDTCSSDRRSVTEYYCDESGSIRNASIACGSEEVCREGACVAATCTDSDGGQTKGTAGTTTLGAISRSDSCHSDTSVTEYYCGGGDILYTTISCGSGYVCDEGACVEINCIDDDESLDGDDLNWFQFKTASSLTIYVGENAMVDDDYYVRLDDVGGTEGAETATFTIYDRDGDDVDTCDLDNGDETNDLCGEGISLEVSDASIDDEYARIRGDVAYLQVYTQDGTITTYTGLGCTKGDEYDIDVETSEFYPKLVASTVKMLGGSYKVTAISNETVTIEIDGDDEVIEDGDEVEINDQDYTFSLEFSDYGLVGWIIEQS